MNWNTCNEETQKFQRSLTVKQGHLLLEVIILHISMASFYVLMIIINGEKDIYWMIIYFINKFILHKNKGMCLKSQLVAAKPPDWP